MPGVAQAVPIAAPTMPEPTEAARAAGLHYVSDRSPGVRRVGAAPRFRYVDAQGRAVRDAAMLARIRTLVIPPAWKEVWICPRADGHLQAVGRDQKGRKQYRYHPRFRAVREEAKYERMVAFARALPQIRAGVERHLGLPGLPRAKVLATVVRLLEATLIRVGNEEYARQNRSYGLTTLRDRHVNVHGSQIVFHFRGKSGKEHEVGVADRRLGRIVKRCQDLPGEELFQYVGDDGARHTVESSDVNTYLREITGQDFTAKDFRTWAGTVLAAWALEGLPPWKSAAQQKKNVRGAIERVAQRLGNTVAICRKCYVHPAVVESYTNGTLARRLNQRAGRALRGLELPREELAVLAFLARRLEHEATRRLPRAARRSRPARSRRSRREVPSGPGPSPARPGRQPERRTPRRPAGPSRAEPPRAHAPRRR
jgi:DNA topoisomerase I